MTDRERLLESFLFGTPDRVPLNPGGARRSTLEHFYATGLPDDVKNYNEYAYRRAGGKLDWPVGGPGMAINERMIPQFEEKVVETLPNSQIVQDWKGNICEIGLEFTPEYLRNAVDFVTRRWVKCPVASWDDWEAMKERYNSATPERLPANAAELKPVLAKRDWHVGFHFSGPFWQMREWLGFEQLCIAFIDDPEMIRDMVSFWTDYVTRLIQRGLQFVTPDEIHLSEDMAYKCFSMISPEMTRKFLLPAYHVWGEVIRDAGIPLYGMDSDGFIGELIPIWMEAGINVCDPIEVAAGNDICEFRKTFGRKMAYRGSVDKRCIAKGGKAIEDEIARLTPVIRDGGFVPSCDHGVPANVDWPDYEYYVALLAKATGWL